MGGRAGGGARSAGGGSNNPYRQEFDMAFQGQIRDIQSAISEVTRGGKYSASAANYLKTEVLGTQNSAAITVAKKMIIDNQFAYLSDVEIVTLRKGGYAAANAKMAARVKKALGIK